MQFQKGCDENKIMEIAIEAGADDVITNDDGTIDVTTSADNFETVKNALIAGNLTPTKSEVTMIASTECQLTDRALVAQMIKLSDMLEDLDDVQNVYSNANIDDQLL